MELVIFGLTLLGVALFHRWALTVAFAGFVLTAFVRVISAPAGINAQAYETINHLASEWGGARKSVSSDFSSSQTSSNRAICRK